MKNILATITLTSCLAIIAIMATGRTLIEAYNVNPDALMACIVFSAVAIIVATLAEMFAD